MKIKKVCEVSADWIRWASENLHREFDNAMMDEMDRVHLCVGEVPWADGKHRVYCMGGEL